MKMYISNLGFHVTGDDLQKLFASFGNVSSASVIKDRESGNSKGFGFIEMGSEKEASLAMSALNGKEIEGRHISVSLARERSSRRW